ncbi:hypothetical protein MKEN_00246700 [Mycena kentingensis (nom. inval.)]|nr:hypothetical protein MKEN_00246700 [Mycena kentingensis (nom. inval.)]
MSHPQSAPNIPYPYESDGQLVYAVLSKPIDPFPEWKLAPAADIAQSRSQSSIDFRARYSEILRIQRKGSVQLHNMFLVYGQTISEGSVPPLQEGTTTNAPVKIRLSESDRNHLFGLSLLSPKHLVSLPKTEADVVQAVNRMISGPVFDIDLVWTVFFKARQIPRTRRSRLSGWRQGLEGSSCLLSPKKEQSADSAKKKKEKPRTHIPTEIKSHLTFCTDDIVWTLKFGLLVVEFKGPKTLETLATDISALVELNVQLKDNDTDKYYASRAKDDQRATHLRGVQSLLLQICRYSRDYGVSVAYVTDFNTHCVFELPTQVWAASSTATTGGTVTVPEIRWLMREANMPPRLFMLWALYHGSAGSETLSSRYVQSQSTCTHTITPVKFLLGEDRLDRVPHDEFHRRIAALRLLRFNFPLISCSNSFVEKYITPVLRVVRDVLVLPRDDDSRPEISWVHTQCESTFLTANLETNVESIRVYYQDGTTRKLFCIILFASPICWPAFSPSTFQPITHFGQMVCSATTPLAELWQHLRSTENPAFILTTDEHRACILSDFRPIPNFLGLVHYDVRTARESLRNLVAQLLFQLPLPLFHGRPSPPEMQGVLNRVLDASDTVIARPMNPRGFRDFDRFTMERSLPDLEVFLAWKEQVSEYMANNPVPVGAQLGVQLDALANDEDLWRCPFPSPVVPRETYEAVTRAPRMRNRDVDEILESKRGSLSFEVTRVVRHEVNTFSQVFFGVLHGGDGRKSSPVCLKLYLDLMFPVNGRSLRKKFGPPLSDLWFDQIPISDRLASLHYAEDMVRREEAAYDRLREYQGTLIPHCYGFHRFTLPSGTTAYGVLMEIISGSALADLAIAEWASRSQTAFVQQLRHGLRALLYAGVGQCDWHGGQILLPDGGEYKDGHGLVFIDFAFAIQRFGDEQAPGVIALHPSRGHMSLKYLLLDYKVPEEVIGDLFESSSLHLNEY